jgi:hypothetical protein
LEFAYPLAALTQIGMGFEMRKLVLAAAAATSVLVSFQIPEANASGVVVETFSWVFSGTYTFGTLNGDSVSGSGTLEATNSGGNSYSVDSISGTVDGLSVTGLADYALPDQTVYWPGSPQLDFAGLAFTVTGGQAYNLFFIDGSSGMPGGPNPDNPTWDCGVAGYCLIGPGTVGTTGLDPDSQATISFLLAPVATPLPSTWFMLLGGLIGLGFFAYRGTRKNISALAAV